MTSQSLNKRGLAGGLEPTDDLAAAGLKALARKIVKQATSNNQSSVSSCDAKQRDNSAGDKPGVIKWGACFKKNAVCFAADSLKARRPSFMEN